MQNYFISSWDNHKKTYVLKECNLLPTSKGDKPENSINGFVKYFLYGRSIIVVEHSESSFIVLRNKKVRVSEIVNIDLKQYFIFDRIQVTTKDDTYTFIDLSVGDFFDRTFNPTYDYLDQEQIFGVWFLALCKKIKTQQ